MINRPTNEEQIQMVLKSLSPIYRKHLFAQYFPDFKALTGAGTQVEDALIRGDIKVEQPCKRLRTTFNEGSSDEGSSDEVNTIIPPILPSHPPRQFAELCKPLDQILEILKDQKLLQPLEPRPLPKSIPKSFNRDEYCNFHQYPGHSTNQCYRLRHEIQDLIDRELSLHPISPIISFSPPPHL
ncbi:hypothetical protein DVA67_035920, partial [Solirubrobacter sp. CPCC 204708]|nr:hypothetical protein [Solirubrobacter deserti]